MTDLTPAPNPQPPSPSQPGALRCAGGSVVAGAMASACYFLTSSIAQTFASKPVLSDNITVLNIASAVRTLVVGLSALATGVFALASLGLMALAGQILIQQLGKQPAPPEDAGQ
ncbi:DUF3082 domain-containing protein [Kamptonema formosum]|uniref:DUF3082 domain-containing protein n=1 Tax=Kamptonema formosum TaxID=331992 RepID=UPI000345D7D6|nr:DUF3082 domain-containing protein [Oscillatoria sp. PCC 10802]